MVTIQRGRGWTPFTTPGTGHFAIVVTLGAVASFAVAAATIVEAPRLPEGMPFAGVVEQAQGNTGTQVIYNVHVWAIVALMACWLAVLARPTFRRLWIAFSAWTAPQFLALTADVFNYVEQGWVVLQGYDPTIEPAASIEGPFSHWVGSWAGTTVGYPAGALLTSAAVVAIAGAHPVASLFLMHVPAVAGVVLAGVCLPRIATAMGLDPRLAFGFVILNPFTLLELCGAAHNDALAFGLAVAAIWWAVRCQNPLPRILGAALLLGLAATVKPQALAFAALLPAFGLLDGAAGNVFRRPFTAYAEGISTAVAALGVLLVSGPLTGVGQGFMSATGTPGYRSSAPFQIVRIPLDSLMGERFTSSFFVQHFDTICLVLVLIGTLLTIALLRITQPVTMLTVLFGAFFLLGPAFRPWYAIWLLLPLVLAPIRWNLKLPLLGSLMALTLTVKNPQALYLVNEIFAYVLAVAVFIALKFFVHRGEFIGLNPHLDGPTAEISSTSKLDELESRNHAK